MDWRVQPVRRSSSDVRCPKVLGIASLSLMPFLETTWRIEQRNLWKTFYLKGRKGRDFKDWNREES